MSIFWNKRTRSISPYVAGEQPKDRRFIKLNTNENPYPPAPGVIAAIHAELNDGDALRLYPDPGCVAFRQAVSAYTGQPVAHIFASNGSDEALAFACAAFFDTDGAPVRFPDITYSFYPVYMGLYDIPYETIPLDADFRIDIQDYLQQQEMGGMLLSNPNAPTAVAMPLSEVEQLAQALLRHNRVLVVDEAYAEFGAETALPLVDKYPNVLIVHTLSKDRSLAGMRLTYAIGQRHLIEGLERIRDSFNSYVLDRLAIAAGIAAMGESAYYQQVNGQVQVTRDAFVSTLQSMSFVVLPSAANFVFARHPQQDARGLFDKLRERGILVRHFKQPRIDQFLRISIGTEADMAQVAAVLKELL